ncbi:hypothetical protein Tlie_1409 [Thermovirga lienii DSM 17291]|uniref:Uncharacterized protein n=1 Tax=Thermovirga lienii (strain ATCC BAA-1197 / DSM 17291 / Cas60314) TaxID=580340 RepID=G7V6U8_THELD|nr:hypothetical protein [Thermovirga lienii]AER67137.1 hypothetical protein Tlie_1409 [Thermovirga lienii DSM 17291]HCD71380.1 hypothetical protein [Thermovirga lienii]
MQKEIQALIGAIFMGTGAYFLAYSYGPRIWGRRKKVTKNYPEGFYNPKDTGSSERRIRIIKSALAGIAIGIMFFFYFYMK